MFQTEVVEKINTFSFQYLFTRLSRRLCDNEEIYSTAKQATDLQYDVSALLATHAHSLAPPQQQWSNERASVLRYTSIARLVTF